MKKFFSLLFSLILLGGILAPAQTTTVTANSITDSDGTLWSNGTVGVSFVPNPNYPNPSVYTLCSSGAALNPAILNQAPVSIGSGASFSVTTYDNTLVCPVGSQWKFTVCPNASSKCGAATTVTSGASQDITSLVNANIPAPRFNALAGAYGYADIETIVTQPVGATYWNVSSSCQKYYASSVWSCGTLIPSGLAQTNNSVVITSITRGSGYTSLSCALTGGTCTTQPSFMCSAPGGQLSIQQLSYGNCTVAPTLSITGSGGTGAAVTLALAQTNVNASSTGTLQPSAQVGGGSLIGQYSPYMNSPQMTSPIWAFNGSAYPQMWMECSPTSYTAWAQYISGTLTISPFCNGSNDSITFAPSISSIPRVNIKSGAPLTIEDQSSQILRFNPMIDSTKAFSQPAGISYQITGNGLLSLYAGNGGSGYTGAGTCTLTGGIILTGSADTCTASLNSGVVSWSLSGTATYAQAPTLSWFGATGGTGAIAPTPFIIGTNSQTGSAWMDVSGTYHISNKDVGVTGSDFFAASPTGGINVANIPQSVLWYGAVGDARMVKDASIAASSATLTSATANFTNADVGKLVAVADGSGAVYAGTYTSGGTIAGGATTTCTVTVTGTTNAVGYVYLSSTNVINSGSQIYFNSYGSGFASAPTTATLSNGTGATCSGTATITSQIHGLPTLTTISSVTNSTTVTLAATAVTGETGAYATICTDNTTALQNAINAVQNTNGGLYIPAGRYCSQGLTITSPITIFGAGYQSYYGNTGAYALPATFPFAYGAMIQMVKADTNAITITNEGSPVHLHDFGIFFDPTIAFWHTGDGINGSPGNANQGMYDFDWARLTVWGNDTNHWGYNLANPLYCTMNALRVYGGGGFRFNGTTGINDANCTLIQPYDSMLGGGANNGFSLVLNGSPIQNLYALIRPQVIRADPNGLIGSSDLGSLPIPTKDNTGKSPNNNINAPNANAISILQPDFEADAGTDTNPARYSYIGTPPTFGGPYDLINVQGNDNTHTWSGSDIYYTNDINQKYYVGLGSSTSNTEYGGSCWGAYDNNSSQTAFTVCHATSNVLKTRASMATLGTAQTSGNIVLSAGWGSTASVGTVSGYAQRFRFTITSSGTGQAANPTITSALPTTLSSAPLCEAFQIGGTGTNALISPGTETTNSTGAMTYNGTPAAASTYVIQVDCRI